MATINNITNSLYVGYAKNMRQLGKTTLKLVTGSNIPTAEDGIGLSSVYNRLQQNIKGDEMLLNTIENAKGITTMQDTALQGVSEIITDMYSLAKSALDPTKGIPDRAAMDRELINLKDELKYIYEKYNFNGTPIFQASSSSIDIRYGGNTNDTLNIGGINLVDLYNSISAATYSVSDATSAQGLIDVISHSAATGVNVRLQSMISDVGSNMSQMSRIQEMQGARQAAMINASSAIRDIDVAKEAANFTMQQVRVMGAQSILNQSLKLAQNTLQFYQ